MCRKNVFKPKISFSANKHISNYIDSDSSAIEPEMYSQSEINLEPYSYTERENTTHVIQQANPFKDTRGVPRKNVRRRKSRYYSRNTALYSNFRNQLAGKVTTKTEGYLNTEIGVNDPFSIAISPPKNYYLRIKRHLPSFVKQTLFIYTQYRYHLDAAYANNDTTTWATAEQYGEYLQEYLDFIYEHLNSIFKVPSATVNTSSKSGGAGLTNAYKTLVDILTNAYNDKTTRHILDVKDKVKIRIQEDRIPTLTRILYISDNKLDKTKSFDNLTREVAILTQIINDTYARANKKEVEHEKNILQQLALETENVLATYIDCYSRLIDSFPDNNTEESITYYAVVLDDVRKEVGKNKSISGDKAIRGFDARILEVWTKLREDIARADKANKANASIIEQEEMNKDASMHRSKKANVPTNLYIHNYLPAKTKDIPEGISLSEEDAESLNTNNILLVEGDIGKPISPESKSRLRKAFDYADVMRYYETIKKYYDLNDTLYENVSVDLFLVPAGLTNLYAYLNNAMLSRKPIKPPVQVGKLITVKGVEGRQVGLFIVVSYTF